MKRGENRSTGENRLGAKERTNKLRGQDEGNPTFSLATREGKGLVIFLYHSPRSFSRFTLALALALARWPMFSKRTKRKKNNVFVQASKGPHLARSGLIKEKFSFLGLFWLSNKSFINQDCSVKLAGYWTC